MLKYVTVDTTNEISHIISRPEWTHELWRKISEEMGQLCLPVAKRISLGRSGDCQNKLSGWNIHFVWISVLFFFWDVIEILCHLAAQTKWIKELLVITIWDRIFQNKWQLCESLFFCVLPQTWHLHHLALTQGTLQTANALYSLILQAVFFAYRLDSAAGEGSLHTLNLC